MQIEQATTASNREQTWKKKFEVKQTTAKDGKSTGKAKGWRNEKGNEEIIEKRRQKNENEKSELNVKDNNNVVKAWKEQAKTHSRNMHESKEIWNEKMESTRKISCWNGMWKSLSTHNQKCLENYNNNNHNGTTTATMTKTATTRWMLFLVFDRVYYLIQLTKCDDILFHSFVDSIAFCCSK